MTDAEKRDAALAQLKLTTVGFINKRWTTPPPGSHWQLALDYLNQIGQTTPPPPPPSSGKHIGNGFILFRYGSSWGAEPASTYDSRYGVVVVGYGNDTDAAKLTKAVGLGYRTAVELEDVTDPALSTGGVTLTQARANGWLLKDAAGHELVPQGYSGEWCGNLSHPAYQAACFQTYNARAAATGLRGFFLDNVVPSPWFNAAPANIYGGLSFDAAYVSFLKAMRAACPGLYFLANAGPGGPSWATRIAPYVDGLITENPGDNTGLQAFIDATNQAGKDAYALISTDPAGTLAKSRAQAFAGKWLKPYGGFGIDYGSADPWNSNWTGAVGG